MTRTLWLSTPIALLALLLGCQPSSGSGQTSNAGQASASGSGSASASGPANLANTTSASGTTPTQNTAPTLHPLVLMHGAGGFGNPDYFSGVPQLLDSLGCELLVTQVSSQLPIAQRAAALEQQVLARFPQPDVKLNLIAHSLGGLDARALIGRPAMADRVASLSTLATPHRGTEMCDLILASSVSPFQQGLTNLLLQSFGMNLALVAETSTTHIQGVFNPAHPDDSRVFYQSWTGLADPLGVTGTSLSANYLAGWPFLYGAAGDNDGLVPVHSSIWGQWHGTLRADHVDFIGNRPAVFDHLDFFQQLVEDLGSAGY